MNNYALNSTAVSDSLSIETENHHKLLSIMTHLYNRSQQIPNFWHLLNRIPAAELLTLLDKPIQLDPESLVVFESFVASGGDVHLLVDVKASLYGTTFTAILNLMDPEIRDYTYDSFPTECVPNSTFLYRYISNDKEFETTLEEHFPNVLANFPMELAELDNDTYGTYSN